MPDHHPTEQRSGSLYAWIALIGLLVLAGPQFVCMPLTNDVAYYDLQTKLLMDGGVLYRDCLEPNLPGVVWVHAAVRSTLGWSSEAMRSFDLLLMAGTVALLAAGIATRGRGGAARVWFAAATLLFYVSISEWCHAQRDVWLLFPVSVGLWMRARHVRRAQVGESRGAVGFAMAIVEGTCWGCAVWIKPHVIFPALAVWLVSALAVRRWRTVGIDLAGLLAGGLLTGAAGLYWLHASGAWPYFIETMLEWNPEYLASSRDFWAAEHLLHMGYRLFPWILIHLMSAGLSRPQASAIDEAGPLALPPGFPEHLAREFPWSAPIVFRSGTLVVHELPAPPDGTETDPSVAMRTGAPAPRGN